MTSTDLDPRFDPRFQRGYDSSRHSPAPQEATAPEVVVEATFADPVPDVEVVVEDTDFADFPEERTRVRNPYLVTLFVLPVPLLGVSAYLLFLYAESISTMYSGPYNQDYLLVTVVPMIIPALIVTAFASLIVVFTRLALGSARRA